MLAHRRELHRLLRPCLLRDKFQPLDSLSQRPHVAHFVLVALLEKPLDHRAQNPGPFAQRPGLIQQRDGGENALHRRDEAAQQFGFAAFHVVLRQDAFKERPVCARHRVAQQ